MKMVCIDKNIYKVYVNKYYYAYNKDTMNECIKRILVLLKKIYDLEIYSNINIKCYINDNYGMILEIEKEYDPFYLYTKKTNLDICYYNDSKFLYSVDDYFIKDKLNNYKMYIHNGKYYIELFEDNKYIIEHTNEILYDKVVKEIIS